MSENMLQDKKVLVVEDNIINQMVVKHSLQKLGASTDIAGDGAEAIAKIKGDHYDLVLMDIQMPVMDGYETTHYIRNQMNCTIPIIAMTAFALKGEDEKCFQSGMNGYVSKPFTVESLHHAINKVFDSPTIANANPNVLNNPNVSVDISMLYEIAGNDDAYIRNMIATFLEVSPVTLAKIETAYNNSDWENLYKAAHYAKSSLAVIKVADMYEWVTTIEYKAKNKVELDTLFPLIELLKDKYIVVEKLLSEKFSFNINSVSV